jgi:subtilase family serine protease
MKIYRKLLEILLVGLAVLGFSGSFAFAQTPQGGSNGNIVRVDQGRTGRGFAQHPLYLKVLGRDSHGAAIFARSSKPASALGAGVVSQYLNLSNKGAGQTIAIVDAYDHPNIESDLNHFSSDQNLPTICSSGQDPSSVDDNCFNFSKIYAQGSQPKTDPGWALEIALDVEWAHAVAPKANIVLVEAASNSYTNLFEAIHVAARVSGVVVISNSWGGGEFSSETNYDIYCKEVLCVFSSGDSGNPGGYPAYNPYVIAVGGTTLNLASDGTPTSEVAWSGSGGGVSLYEDRPLYQGDVNPNGTRGMPDVSYDADPNTGFLVYDSVRYHGYSGWFQVGGTSAGAPQWAAIIAAADQSRGAGGPLSPVDFAASIAIYGLGGSSSYLYDITSGSNGNCGSICQAVPGYDFVTGLGSPRSGIDLALAGGSTSNNSPVAKFTYDCMSGLSCTFDATTSTGDNITDYSWNFGDNSDPGSGVTVSHTFSSAGTYTVTLTVTDKTGTGSSTQNVTVSDSGTPSTTTVTASISYSLSGGHNNNKDLNISVSGKDSSGQPVANVSVSIEVDLDGSTYGTATGTTNTNGVASFVARNAPSGTYTTTVINDASSGLTWDTNYNSYNKP